MKDVYDFLVKKAQKAPAKIIFAEGDEPRIIEAAAIAAEKKVARPVLIGDEDGIRKYAVANDLTLDGIEIIPPATEAQVEEMTEFYMDEDGLMPEAHMREMFRKNLYYGAMLVHRDEADAMIAGFTCPTADVVIAAQTVIGMKDGNDTTCAMFIMEIPGYDGPEGQVMAFADCSVFPNPDENQLADIAILTADTVHSLLGWEPRLAMLSFSTKGSADNEMVGKVRAALSHIHERRPDLKADGEFQLDAAIDPAMAAKKIPCGSEVAGKGNIMIFPDLNAGNITSKAIQYFAHASLYGPFMQGFAKTVSDLSRSSSLQDILGVIVMVSITAQNQKEAEKEIC